MSPIKANLQAVEKRIEAALRTSGRAAGTARLVAVSKTFPAQSVRDAAEAGQRDFGENYVQEAVEKIRALKELGLTWHFIGPIQSNKTRDIAANFDWVHTIEREKIATRLSEARDANRPELQVCIQVNVSRESTKSGVAPDEVLPLARNIAKLPRLKLRGLMAIPEPTTDIALQQRRFAQLRQLRDAIVAEGLAMDTLSMGMSADLEAAIAEGATLVRVGTAIFGARITIGGSA